MIEQESVYNDVQSYQPQEKAQRTRGMSQESQRDVPKEIMNAFVPNSAAMSSKVPSPRQSPSSSPSLLFSLSSFLSPSHLLPLTLKYSPFYSRATDYYLVQLCLNDLFNLVALIPSVDINSMVVPM